MAASASIFNGAAQPAALPAPRAMDNSSSNSNSSNTGSNISANDFLTLLVTEMKNQDPTSAQDPNQYINQLVGVNSLQQLIQINETLSGAMDPSATGHAIPADSATSAARPGTGSHASGSIPITQPRVQPQPILGGSGAHVISGNLSLPATSPAAHRIAGALSTHTSRP